MTTFINTRETVVKKLPFAWGSLFTRAVIIMIIGPNFLKLGLLNVIDMSHRPTYSGRQNMVGKSKP